MDKDNLFLFRDNEHRCCHCYTQDEKKLYNPKFSGMYGDRNFCSPTLYSNSNNATSGQQNITGNNENAVLPTTANNNNNKASPFAILMSVPPGPALATPFMDSAPPPIPASLCGQNSISSFANSNTFTDGLSPVTRAVALLTLDDPFNLDEPTTPRFSALLSIYNEFDTPAKDTFNDTVGLKTATTETQTSLTGINAPALQPQRKDPQTDVSQCTIFVQSSPQPPFLSVSPQLPLIGPPQQQQQQQVIMPSFTQLQKTKPQFTSGNCSNINSNNFQEVNKPQQQPSLLLLSSSSPSSSPLPVPLSTSGNISLDDSQPIDSFAGHIYSLCHDQNGCRYLQKKLDGNDARTTGLIFVEVLPYTPRLMADPFGNYLCQKLLEHCNDAQRYSILRRVSTDLVQISMNAHGTRAVQKLIDTIHTQDEIETIQREFRPCVVQMIQDSNSNHVIQRCLNKLSPQDKQFIYDAVTEGENIVKVATHRHGCCVLQRCIDHASEQQKLQIINEIVKHAFALVQDPFGNYVVQYILDLGLAEVPKKLAVHLKGHFVELSTQKFSSNVVEKIMQSSDPAAIETVVAEVIAYKKIDLLLQDPYANYVIQTALTRSSDKQHKELSDAIFCHIAVLRTTPYGKRIQAKMHRDSSSSDTIPSVYSTHNSH